MFTNLLLHSLKLLCGGSGWHKLQWILNSHGRWVSGRTFGNPLFVFRIDFQMGNVICQGSFNELSWVWAEYKKKGKRKKFVLFRNDCFSFFFLICSLNLNNAINSAIHTLISKHLLWFILLEIDAILMKLFQDEYLPYFQADLKSNYTYNKHY